MIYMVNKKLSRYASLDNARVRENSMSRTALAALASSLALFFSSISISTTPAKAEFRTTTTSNGQVVYRGTNIPIQAAPNRSSRSAPVAPHADNDHDRSYRGRPIAVRPTDRRDGYSRGDVAGRGVAERPRYDDGGYRRGGYQTAYRDRPYERGDGYRSRYDNRRPTYDDDAGYRRGNYRSAYHDRRPYGDDAGYRRDGYRSAGYDQRPSYVDDGDYRRDGYRSADYDRRPSYGDDAGYRRDGDRPAYERPYGGGGGYYRGNGGGYRPAYSGAYDPPSEAPRADDDAVDDEGDNRSGYGVEYRTAGYYGGGHGGGHGGGYYNGGCCGGGQAVVRYSCSVTYTRYGWRGARVSAC